MRFQYTFVFVSDVDATAAWYRDVLGMPLRSGPHDGEWALLGSDDHALGLDDRRAGPKRAGGGLPSELCESPPAGCYLVLEFDDVDAIYARALEAGAEGVSAPWTAPSGSRVAWIRDPAGMLVELWHNDTPAARGGRRREALRRLRIPLALCAAAAVGLAVGWML